MGKSEFMLLLIGVVAAVVLQCAAAQTVHVVGWVIPPGGETEYATWASTKTFMVGDILTFNFTTNKEDVLEVSKASHDACNSTNPIGTTITNGPANITLFSVGEHYYICTFGQHCLNGQKLAITVSASPATTLLPVHHHPRQMLLRHLAPLLCHAVAKAAEGRTQLGPTTPSSSSVFANFFVTLLSIAIGLLEREVFIFDTSCGL